MNLTMDDVRSHQAMIDSGSKKLVPVRSKPFTKSAKSSLQLRHEFARLKLHSARTTYIAAQNNLELSKIKGSSLSQADCMVEFNRARHRMKQAIDSVKALLAK